MRIFFKNPELAWDVASTIGNDGSYYMLKRLAHVSEKASDARINKFNDSIKSITDKVYNLVKGEFRTNDQAEMLASSIKSARRFEFTLSRACEKEPDFFGKMIQYLQVNSNFVATLFSKVIHSGAILNHADPSDYDILVRRVEEAGYVFETSPTDEAYKKNFAILQEVFGIDGPEDPLLKNIDVSLLFQSTYKRRCSPSVILAENLVNYWSTNLKKPENSVFFTKAGFDDIVFSDFVTNFVNMIAKAKLADKISSAIHEYVDFNANIAAKNEELIADIATNIYNGFVMNLGYNLLSEELKSKAKEISESNNLPQIKEVDEGAEEVLSEQEQLDVLFNQLEVLNDGHGGQLIQLPAYQSLRTWLSYVFMSYTIAYDVVGADDVEKNNMLGKILESFSKDRKNVS